MRAMLLLLLMGCRAEPPERFWVSVSAITDEGDALGGLAVKVDGISAARTDANGSALLEVPGPRGRRVRVSVETPQGHRALSDGRLLVLERLKRTGGGDEPLQLQARFAPRTRKAVVIVDVGRPGLPVQIFGQERALTDANGIAMVLTSGAPEDHVEVRVSNGGTRLSPPQITKTFTFPDRPEAFVLAGTFADPPKPRPKPLPRPKRL